MKRQSDPKDVSVFRCDRFFLVDGRYFFTTREGTNEGPFASADEAHSRLTQYLLDRGIKIGHEPWDTPGVRN
jgi:Domain of unknown function (DUF6316)